MKKMISVIAAAVMLMTTACSFWNNGKSKEAEGVKKVPVSQIWDGCEKLQGQDYENIKLPNKIEKQAGTDKLYTLKQVLHVGDLKDLSTKFFKTFLGEEYEEQNVVDADNQLFCHTSGKSYAIFCKDPQSPINAVRYDYERTFVPNDIIGDYTVDKDRDKVLDLSEGKCTVGELCDSVDRFIAEAMPQYLSGDLKMKAYRVYYHQEKRTDDKEPERFAEVVCPYFYKGVMLDDGSGYEEETILEGFQVRYSYAVFKNYMTMLGKDDLVIYNSMTVPYDVTAEELTEMIPLENAVEILKNELAKGIRYEFDDISLKYCIKGVAPTEMDPETRMEQIDKLAEYNAGGIVPTWCFDWTGYDANGALKNSIRVNAVTGEITVDVKDSVKRPSGSDSTPQDDTSSQEDDSDEDRLEYPNIDELPEPVSYITVDAVSYKDSVLTYEYEGETKTVTMNFYALFRDASSIPIRIINNSHGIKVKTELGLDENGEVVKADVKKYGGTFIDGMFGRERPDEKEWEKAHPRTRPEEATARRIKGSIYEISNENGSVTVDLNDLDYYEKCPYPDVVERVIFSAFQFESGETVLIDFYYLDDYCFSEVDDGKQTWTTSTVRRKENDKIFYMYAGKIQSLNGDRAEIILNDGKTVLDVPTYYRDCELREGMNVFLAVEESHNLWNDKKHWKIKFALITADPGKKEPGQPIIKKYSQLDHSNIAYARRLNNTMYDYTCVMVDDDEAK